MDEYVVPETEILDYNTQYSGITPEHMANATKRLKDIQVEFLNHVSADTPLIGHSVWHDLKCLKIRHTTLVDTAVHFESARGPPYRPALRYLAQRFLARIIQNSQMGHDSVEDATACADLVKLKIKHGLQFGIRQRAQIHLFDAIAAKEPTSTIGFNNRAVALVDTSYHCQTIKETLLPATVPHLTTYPSGHDDEAVNNMVQAVKEGNGMVFGKLKTMDTVYRDALAKEATTGQEESDKTVALGIPIAEKYIDSLLQSLWEKLEPGTALLVCSGHGDIRIPQR